jgi:hypothetical protein
VISTRVKIEVRIIRFIDLTVLTLGEIYIWVVHNYPVKKLASGVLVAPVVQWQRKRSESFA